MRGVHSLEVEVAGGGVVDVEGVGVGVVGARHGGQHGGGGRGGRGGELR